MIELLFALLIGVSEPAQDQVILYHTLAIEAPETLERPQETQFIEYQYYSIALERFEKFGHWATPHNWIYLKEEVEFKPEGDKKKGMKISY
ncbi:hypothetical protein LCGC14_1098160 [marine sediment metagenome]|uniref:Uncharacterized protein n=1 Tax=marine sediment metagenome TaxID=412755 RepID=A0A0F9MET2_9ZZZZ|nr:hypothetical protein [bacterium]